VTTLFIEDVEIGSQIPVMKKVPTAVGLFRFSAVTWNPHLIHYNRDVAMSEGHENIVVHSHLHGAYLMQALESWAGPRARVTKFGWQNKQAVVVGQPMLLSGIVTEKSESGSVRCQLEGRTDVGDICSIAWADVLLPSRKHARSADQV
jgi:hydroxyacyl-ACP dehydratase HTD2-like protein with hotdog domain